MIIKEEELEYTKETIKNAVSSSSLITIVDLLLEEGIATRSEKESNPQIYIGGKKPLDAISYCLALNNDNYKIIEKWELEKVYRHAMLFEILNLDESMFQHLIDNDVIVPYSKINGMEELFSLITKPSIIFQDKQFILKFNLKFKAQNSFGETIKQRYSVLTIFYLEENVLEIRFDSIPSVYERDKESIINSVLAWIRSQMKITVYPFQMEPIIDYMKSNVNTKRIVLSGQDMLMASGGKATVDIGNSEEDILPFIGELKQIMATHIEELEKVPDLHHTLEDFIFEKENLSEFPWVKFKFIEYNSMEAKFTFDYGKEKACIIQYLYNNCKKNHRKGRMDYVTNCIFGFRENIKKIQIE